MKVRLHIERLILDGLEGHDPAQLRAAIEAELTRLLGGEGSAPLPSQGLAVASITAPGIGAAADDAQQLGAQIAQAVQAGLGGLGATAPGHGDGAP